MSLSLIAGVLLAVLAALASWRVARLNNDWRSFEVWAQPLLALAFWLMLFPPGPRLRSETLIVLTPGATAAQRTQLPSDIAVIALPGAAAPASIERAPDLATALRQHAAVTQITVIGTGLPARDREALGQVAVHFEAAPLQGFIDLQVPQRVRSGALWSAQGRVAAPAVRIELRDPSGALAVASDADRDGRFHLSSAARGEGPVRYELRALDAQANIVDRAVVPLQVEAGVPLKVIVRAGAPDADLKYWRRWASDAGLQLALSVGLSDKLAQHEGDAALDAQTLATTDVLMIDERAWLALTPAEKSAIAAAVNGGLGLLLRITGPVDASVMADWRGYGYTVGAAELGEHTLDTALGLSTHQAWAMAPVSIDAADAQPLIKADDGTLIAGWHAQGQGRVAVWTLLDSYRLVLSGEGARHGSLWARTLGVLARPRAVPPEPEVPEEARVDQRTRLCGALEGTSGPDICRAWWPTQAGWQWLHSANGRTPFYVRAADEDQGLQAAADQRATTELQRKLPSVPASGPRSAGPRWPWFLLWLGLAGALWWRERKRW